MLKWLRGDANAEQNERYWSRAVDVLNSIEKELNTEMIIK
jgi:hypothetical protein